MTTPTHVFGQGAREWRDQFAPNAKLLQGSTLNPADSSGQTPDSPAIIQVTEGAYSGIDYYLGKRAYVEVRGNVQNKPKLIRDKIAVESNTDLTLRGLELVDCEIGIQGYRGDAPPTLLIEDCYQYGQTNSDNGVINPNDSKLPPTFIYRRFVQDGCGDPGNTKHGSYLECRPGSTWLVEDSEFYGARACSILKGTVNSLQIRRSIINTRSRLTPGVAAHTLVDIPACSELIMSECQVELWRNPIVDKNQQNNGLMTGGVFRRLRESLYGSDIPPYPAVSWDPPKTFDAWRDRGSPGGGWDGTPETYVNPEFWDWVGEQLALPPQEADGLFPAWISDCTFTVPDDSLPASWLRDDGTRPHSAIKMFGPYRANRAPPGFRERSTTLSFRNKFIGAVTPAQLNKTQNISEWAEGSLRNRTEPYHFPRLIEVEPEYVPTIPGWFKR